MAVPALATDNIFVLASPSRSYFEILPGVTSIDNTNVFDNWLIVRSPEMDSILVDNDSGGKDVVYSTDTKWKYYLYFFSDDYSFVLNEKNVGSSSCPHNVPYIGLNASIIYTYKLDSPTFESLYVSDDTLDYSAGLSYWSYDSVTNDYVSITYNYWTGFTTIPSQFGRTLNHTFVGSSISASFDLATWSYLATPGSGLVHMAEQDEEHGSTGYTTPNFGWEATYYDSADENGFDSTGSGDSSGGDLNGDGAVTWLEKIWNAIVNGFNSVIDKLNEIIEKITGETPIDDGVKEDSDNAVQSGQSIQQGMEGIMGDYNSSGALDDFFNSSGEGSGNLDFFGDESSGGFFDNVNSFFEFMRNLWGCIPLPVQTLFAFVFSGFLILAVFKMFF